MAKKKKNNKMKRKQKRTPNLIRKETMNEIMAEETDPQQLPLADTPPRSKRFMDLPPELRLLVYEFTLTEAEQPVQVDRGHLGRFFPLTNPPALSVGLMGTCKEVRKEIAEMYYHLNDFQFRGMLRLHKWLKDRNRREQFRSITCYLDAEWKSKPIIQLLGLCTALVTLNIRVETYELSDMIRLGRFRPLHGFFEAEAVMRFPDGSRLSQEDLKAVPSYLTEILERESLVQLLEQLESSCPGRCAGCKDRKRVEIVFEIDEDELLWSD